MSSVHHLALYYVWQTYANYFLRLDTLPLPIAALTTK